MKGGEEYFKKALSSVDGLYRGAASSEEGLTTQQKLRGGLVLLGGVLLIAVVTTTTAYAPWFNGGSGIMGEAGDSRKPPFVGHGTTNFDEYENCTAASFHEPEPRKEWTTQPMWFVDYPGTLSDQMKKSIGYHLTGMKGGFKSFYMSIKKQLKHCHGTTETALCTVHHPLVLTGPEKMADSFAKKIVIGIRSIATVFPAHVNQKAIAYHNHQGQLSEDAWREARDQYYKTAFEQWTGQIMTWKNMSKTYRIAMYFPYEYLMNETKAPKLLSRLAAELESVGFPKAVKEDKDLPCTWFQSVGREDLEQFQNHGYEYSNFYPSYTAEQLEYLLNELDAFAEENKDDTELVGLLREYQDEIRQLPPDEPWVNRTAVAGIP